MGKTEWEQLVSETNWQKGLVLSKWIESSGLDDHLEMVKHAYEISRS